MTCARSCFGNFAGSLQHAPALPDQFAHGGEQCVSPWPRMIEMRNGRYLLPVAGQTLWLRLLRAEFLHLFDPLVHMLFSGGVHFQVPRKFLFRFRLFALQKEQQAFV